MRFYKDTNGVWLCNNRVAISGTLDAAFHGTDVVIKKLGQDSVDAEYYRGPITNIEKETAPGAGTFIPVTDKADFLLTYKDFFVNPLNPLKEDVEGLQQDVSAIQGGYLGTLLHTDAAPEPGLSGIYKFISAGVVSWLSGTPTVAVGDEVSVVFTDPTYTYTYIQNPYELLANKQNSLAVDGTGVKFPTVDATNTGLALKVAYTDSLKYYPVINYGNRVIADSGVISDIEKLTKLYIENLKLLDNTVFLWDGSAGMKTRTSGVNEYAAKAYDMSASNNDAVQATEANQPHVSGLVAPNEQRKLKGLTGETGTKGLTGTDIQIESSGAFTLAIAVKWNYPRTSSRIYLSATNYIELTASAITLIGDSGNVLTCSHNFRTGLTEILIFEYNNGAGLIGVNGVEKTTTATYGAVTFGSLFLNQTSYNFDGEIGKLQIANIRLSTSQIQSLYNFTRLQSPEIEDINIGNQHWATSNYEGVVTGNGTIIPEVQDNAAWAALTTPAWCYYNNDPLNGAVYGKLYNWYAVQAIADNPPSGWRVPTEADFLQLVNYLGGTSVAGGKMKKDGLTYWNSPNTGATNESGFSAIGGAWRAASTGEFQAIRYDARFHNSNFKDVVLFNDDTTIILTGSTNDGRGYSLRLIRNEPVGYNERTISTGYITNALGATNLDISIPFGYQVESVRIDSETNITGLSAKLYTGVLTELETLFTAKSVTANVQKVIAADADQSIQQTDAVVRINGTKADTTKRFRVWVKLTKVVFS